jgi:hypothetical protein
VATKKKSTTAKPDKGAKKDKYPRQARGQFAASTPDQPNPGKPKGATNWANRRIADVSREYLDKHADDVIAWLLGQRKNAGVLLETIKFLTERADGKAPQTIKHGLDPDSPEGILLRMANQPIPGQGDDDEETRTSTSYKGARER